MTNFVFYFIWYIKHDRYDFMLFDGRKLGEGVAYNTMYTYICDAFDANEINNDKKTHAGRRQGAMDLKSGGYVTNESYALE